MKRLFGILLGLLIATVVLVSCSEETSGPALSDDIKSDINSAATVDALFEDVDAAVDEGADATGSAGADDQKAEINAILVVLENLGLVATS